MAWVITALATGLVGKLVARLSWSQKVVDSITGLVNVSSPVFVLYFQAAVICRGDEYKEHTKCISEEEKYSGKNFQPKANANKGEKKQEAWVEVSKNQDFSQILRH